MLNWIKKKLIRFHENRALYHFKHLCVKYKTGNCPKEKCPYFLRRNPYSIKGCSEYEMFESCPLLDFNDVIIGRACKEIHAKYEQWKKDKGIIKLYKRIK